MAEPTAGVVDNPTEVAAVADATGAAAAEAATAAAATGATETLPGTTKPTPKIPAAAKPSLDVNKSYEELRREFTQRTQAHAADRKAWEAHLATQNERLQSLESMLKASTAKPYDPDAFMEELRTHGPKSLEGWLKEGLTSATKPFDERFQKVDSTVAGLEMKWELLTRRLDTKNYPDFESLEAEISKAVQDPATPIDFNKPLPQVLDALYKYVKLSHSQDALKEAERRGRAKTEEELAAEAAASVAGGGGTTSPATPDYVKMSAEQMRADLARRGLVAER